MCSHCEHRPCRAILVRLAVDCRRYRGNDNPRHGYVFALGGAKRVTAGRKPRRQCRGKMVGNINESQVLSERCRSRPGSPRRPRMPFDCNSLAPPAKSRHTPRPRQRILCPSATPAIPFVVVSFSFRIGNGDIKIPTNRVGRQRYFWRGPGPTPNMGEQQ